MAAINTTHSPRSPPSILYALLSPKSRGTSPLLSWLGWDLESMIFERFTFSELIAIVAVLNHATRRSVIDYFKRASSLYVDQIRSKAHQSALESTGKLRKLMFGRSPGMYG
jgi:hypothetical protein